jgi:threonine dehydrogenase-like Zn-dependent dehydrogenase
MSGGAYEPVAGPILYPIAQSKKHPSITYKALEWHGTEDVRVVERAKPMITEPGDALIRITSSTICGSDLHMYHGEVHMEKGDVLGHECMGIVEEVGPAVKDIKVGNRVVVSAVIACGKCWFCKNQFYSCCDTTNPSKECEDMYGDRLAGIFGYSHVTGGFEGGQAEYIRVPIADINLLPVPQELPDEKVLFLSDIICTGWHANEMGGVTAGQTVAVWGCGPVGLMSMMWAKFRGAKRIIGIDNIPYRLNIAKEKLGVEVINFDEVKEVGKYLKKIVPGGPDVCIDAVGFRYSKTLRQKVERTIGLETDVSEIISEASYAVRKMGGLALIGDYFGNTNGFPIGMVMEKGIKMHGSQVFVQKYWKELLGYIQEGKVDPSFVISHTMSLEQGSAAYRMFDRKEDNILKVVLKPVSTMTTK